MARLGIVIGVSENLTPLKSLSACKNDAAAMAAVLRETKRFDEILQLIGKDQTGSKTLKSQLAAFIDKHKSGPIEEVVFYFSGHGDFLNNEFYHILADFDASSRNQTSLANSELDAMVRGLSPALFVKIVDACHSGTSYIKGDDAFDEYVKSTAGTGFKNLYFLYSSQSDEASWTAGELSAFTKSILASLSVQNSGTVRYRDLMSAASDHFASQGRQTPLFVTQADFTEQFCIASPEMQKVVAGFLPAPAAAPTPTPAPSPSKKSMTRLERIKETEEAECSREEATNFLEGITKSFTGAALPAELAEIFDLSVITASEEPEGAIAIGEWLSKHADRSFFAVPTYRTETYKRRVRKDPFGFGASMSRILRFQEPSDEDFKVVDATRDVVSGYVNTAALPYDLLTLRLVPKYKSVMPVECQIAPLASASEIRLFWAFRYHRRSDWDTVVPMAEPLQWNGMDARLKTSGEVEALTQRISSTFNSVATKTLDAKWPEPAPEKPGAVKARAAKPSET